MAMYMKLVASDGKMPDFMVWSGLDSMPWFWEPFQYAWFAIPLAIIGPGILAFALGYMVFRSRVKGVYFAIITQALALIMSTLFIGQQPYTGGTNGITNFSEFFGRRLLDDGTQHMLYTVTVIVMLACYLIAVGITRSRFGRLLVALRDDEDRVRFTGYNVAAIKATIFAIACAMAGVAGALFVPQVGIISPANMAVVPSIEMVIWVAVGGRGTLWGAMVGAVGVGLARNWLSESYPDFWLFFLGGLFIGAVVLFPSGIAGTLRDGVNLLRRKLTSLRPPMRASGGPSASPMASPQVSSAQVGSKGD
jgi:urea transport system permease protein